MNAINSITSVISEMDNVAKIPALRAVVHSMMAKTIGAIRQDIRARARDQQRDETNTQPSLDERNQFDENERSVDQINEAMGFEQQLPPLKQAAMLHAAYDWAKDDLNTLTSSPFEQPLDLKAMLKFMTDRTQPLNPVLIRELAKAAKCDEAHIKRLHELQAQREREALIEATPEIVATFEGFGAAYGLDTDVDALPALIQHQLGVKLVEALGKAHEAVLMRVMRTNRISDLASLPLIEDAQSKVKDWVRDFETANKQELQAAYEAGRTVRTLEDIEPAVA